MALFTAVIDSSRNFIWAWQRNTLVTHNTEDTIAIPGQLAPAHPSEHEPGSPAVCSIHYLKSTSDHLKQLPSLLQLAERKVISTPAYTLTCSLQLAEHSSNRPISTSASSLLGTGLWTCNKPTSRENIAFASLRSVRPFVKESTSTPEPIVVVKQHCQIAH